MFFRCIGSSFIILGYFPRFRFNEEHEGGANTRYPVKKDLGVSIYTRAACEG